MSQEERTAKHGEIPHDLAGRQLVCHGPIEDGDLGIDHLGNKFWADALIGFKVKHAAELPFPIRIYRKMQTAGEIGRDRTELEPPHHSARKAEGAPVKARTDDNGKPPLAKLPWAALHELSNVQVYGFRKYQDFDNYRRGMEVSRNLSCALRHVADYLAGSDKDAESGLNPLAHAFARIGFVLQNLSDGTAIDDRYKAGAK